MVTGAGLTVTSGSSVQFTVTGTDDDAYLLNNAAIEWEVISGSSIVMGESENKNTFTVTTGTGTFTVKVSVTVEGQSDPVTKEFTVGVIEN